MKKSSLFLVLILKLFLFQSVHSEKPRLMITDSVYNRFILWKIYTEFDEVKGRTYIKMDSVLRGKKDFYPDKKWYISNSSKTCETIDLKPNTYYIILGNALCDTPNRVCKLSLGGDDCILHDTPENRKLLSKKWDSTKVIYDVPKSRPKIKGMDIDL